MNIPSLPSAVAEALPAGGASQPTQVKSAEHQLTRQKIEQALSNEQVKAMIEDLQEHLNPMKISINFSTYGQNDEKIAVIVSDDTGKVIREIPSRELQQLYEKMNELIGMFFNGAV